MTRLNLALMASRNINFDLTMTDGTGAEAGDSNNQLFYLKVIAAGSVDKYFVVDVDRSTGIRL
jgi:hypothetical protein